MVAEYEVGFFERRHCSQMLATTGVGSVGLFTRATAFALELQCTCQALTPATQERHR
jgi:hypothetical protein